MKDHAIPSIMERMGIIWKFLGARVPSQECTGHFQSIQEALVKGCDGTVLGIMGSAIWCTLICNMKPFNQGLCIKTQGSTMTTTSPLPLPILPTPCSSFLLSSLPLSSAPRPLLWLPSSFYLGRWPSTSAPSTMKWTRRRQKQGLQKVGANSSCPWHWQWQHNHH